MLRGAAGRELLHISYPRVGHSQKSHHHSQMQDHTALRLGDRVLPRHHGWGHCSGSGATVWTHDTCMNPLSPSLEEGPSLAALLSRAVPSTKGVFVPLPPPQVSQNLAHCLHLPLSHQCCALLPQPITPIAVPHLLWPPPNWDYIEGSSTC